MRFPALCAQLKHACGSPVDPLPLQVRENILFSARMRLPREGWPDARICEYVDAVIEVLGLSECSNTLIGEGRPASGEHCGVCGLLPPPLVSQATPTARAASRAASASEQTLASSLQLPLPQSS